MATPTDNTDARLLDMIQAEFPLGSRPYDEIAARIGTDARDIIERIGRLKSNRIIREISAIFDSAALGYRSALVAFRVGEGEVGAVAANVSAHAGVSHCYSRDAAYNLWFTITLPPESDLDSEIESLAAQAGVQSHMVLPAGRVFKIGVFLPMSGGAAIPSGASNVILSEAKNLPRVPRSAQDDAELDRAAIRALQHDLPLTDQPFADLAAKFGLTEDTLLDRARSLLDCGVMRRYGAVLRHVRAGYRANAMVCWGVLPNEVEEVGARLAAHPSVSHCYERPTYPDWPYTLYTMVHARTDAELDRIVDELAESAGGVDYSILRSVKEYKKSRVRYFA